MSESTPPFQPSDLAEEATEMTTPGRSPSPCTGCEHAGPHLPTTREHTAYRADGQCRVFGCLCPKDLTAPASSASPHSASSAPTASEVPDA